MRERAWTNFLPHAWFMASFGVYLACMTGSFLADDSPETITAMAALEPQHPPGYPLLTLLGKLALLVPLGSPALRISVLAAVWASAAAVMAGLMARDAARAVWPGKIGAAMAAGTTAAAALALSRTFWMAALSAKGVVYSVNVVLLGLILREFLRPLSQANPRRRIPYIALLFGLGAAHHWMSFAAAVPGITVLLAWDFRHRGAARAAALAGFLVLAGVSSYLFLPVRAATPLQLNWGRPDNLDRFVSVVTREQYRSVEAAEREPGYWKLRSGHMGSFLSREWPLWVWAAAVAGAVVLAPGMPKVLAGLLLAAAAVAGGAFFVAYPLPDRLFVTEPYFTPVFFVFAVFSGLGLAWAGLRWPRLAAGRWTALCGAALILLFFRGYRSHDLSRYYLSYDYGVNLLTGTPERSVVFCEGDYDLFSLLYLDEVAQARPDVTPIAAIFLDYDWYRKTAHRILPDVIPLSHERGQIVVTPARPLVYTSQHGGGEGILRPVGLTMRPPIRREYGTEDSLRAWRALRMRGVWRLSQNPPGMEKDLLDTYGLQMARLAGDTSGKDRRLAGYLYERALRFPMEPDTEFRVRIGFSGLLIKLGKKREARAEAERAVRLVPGRLDALVLAAELFKSEGDDETARKFLWEALVAIPPQGMEDFRGRVERMLGSLD